VTIFGKKEQKAVNGHPGQFKSSDGKKGANISFC
jgi:hypothetical protein